jgi:hypothetical protein
MKQHLIRIFVLAGIATVFLGCQSAGSALSTASAFEKIGGSNNVSSIASSFVNSALKDPALHSLTAGKSVDQGATTDKLSNQLCSMLGGGCQAPLTDSEVTSGARKVSADQSRAISSHFASSLESVVSDPAVRQLVTSEIGSKLPGVVGALL